MRNKNDEQLTFGGHLEVLRRMLFRILGVVAIISFLIFLGAPDKPCGVLCRC